MSTTSKNLPGPVSFPKITSYICALKEPSVAAGSMGCIRVGLRVVDSTRDKLPCVRLAPHLLLLRREVICPSGSVP